MGLAVIFGCASLFPTIIIIQRSISLSNGEPLAPMSEKLAKRLTQVINGELLALASIPLAATLMARGVGYADGLPWQAGM